MLDFHGVINLGIVIFQVRMDAKKAQGTRSKQRLTVVLERGSAGVTKNLLRFVKAYRYHLQNLS